MSKKTFYYVMFPLLNFIITTILTLDYFHRAPVQLGTSGYVQHLADHPPQLSSSQPRPSQHVLQQADLRPVHGPGQHVLPSHLGPVQQLLAQPSPHGLAHYAKTPTPLPGIQSHQDPPQRQFS